MFIPAKKRNYKFFEDPTPISCLNEQINLFFEMPLYCVFLPVVYFLSHHNLVPPLSGPPNC